MSVLKRILVSLTAVSTVIVSASAFAAKPADRVSIVDVAVAINAATVTAEDPEGEFFTLYSALLAYPEIAAVLDGNGQFTVFAPTDDAFTDLEENLLQPAFGCDTVFDLAAADPGYVADVLLYHVARGRMDSAEVLPKDQIRMLSKDFVTRTPFSTSITDGLGRTAILEGLDEFADNGVIHVISKVILPYAPAGSCSP